MRTALEVQMLEELYQQAKYIGMEVESGAIDVCVKDSILRASIKHGARGCRLLTCRELDGREDFNKAIQNPSRAEFERDLIISAYVANDKLAELMSKADIIKRREEARQIHLLSDLFDVPLKARQAALRGMAVKAFYLDKLNIPGQNSI